MECLKAFGKPSTEFATLDIRDDGLYTFKCSKNHVTTTSLQEQKFEIIFDIGAMAILDGYHREAVSCFTASLERFYEFYIKIISYKHGIANEELELCWKKISNQSERQIGAYTWLSLLENKKSPLLLSDNWRNFRNNVIHNGLIPEKEKTIEYGQEIINLIYPNLVQIKKNYQEEVSRSIRESITSKRKKVPKAELNSFMSIATILSLSSGEYPENILLEDELKKLKVYRNIGLLG